MALRNLKTIHVADEIINAAPNRNNKYIYMYTYIYIYILFRNKTETVYRNTACDVWQHFAALLSGLPGSSFALWWSKCTGSGKGFLRLYMQTAQTASECTSGPLFLTENLRLQICDRANEQQVS